MIDDQKEILSILCSCSEKQATNLKQQHKKPVDKCEIDEFVKKQQRKEAYKKKAISKWNNNDFLRFFDDTLKLYHVHRKYCHWRKDAATVARIYDMLVQLLRDQMSNKVLKDYFEWWTNLFADQCLEHELFLDSLCNPLHIGRFVLRFVNESPTVAVAATNTSHQTLSDTQIFDLGGLPMLLLRRGIVVACYFLMNKNTKNYQEEIKHILNSMNKAILQIVAKTTLSNSPYAGEPIDFVSIAHDTFKKNGVDNFDNLNYRHSFVHV